MELSDTVLETSVNVGNSVLQNDHVRMYLMVLASVYMSYTLRPVPKWLENLFDNSHPFKLLVLFVAGCIATYPMTKEKLLLVVVVSVGILLTFHLLRKLDKKDEQKK